MEKRWSKGMSRAVALLLTLAMLLSIAPPVGGVLAAEKTVWDQINEKIDYVNGLNPDDYTEDSYNTLKEQVDSIDYPCVPYDGKTGEGMPEAIAGRVLTMLDQLIGGLEEQTIYTRLEALIDEILALNPEDWDETAYNELLEQAQSIIRPIDPNEMPENVAEIVYNMLKNKKDNLKPREDVFTKLEAKLTEAETLDKAAYTEESWAAVQEILDVVDRPVSSDNITEKLAKKMLADLEKALAALEKAPDPTVTLEDGTYMITPSDMTPQFADNVKVTAADGKYTLTFYWSPDRVRYAGDAYNDPEGYGDLMSAASDYDLYMVAVPKDANALMEDGLPAKSVLEGKDIQSAGFEDKIKAAVDEKYNDAYLDVRQETLADGGKAFSVDVTDLNAPVKLCVLYEVTRHRRYGSDIGDKTYYYGDGRSFELNAGQAVALPEFPLTSIDTEASFNFDAAGPGFVDPAVKLAAVDGKLQATYRVSLGQMVSAVKYGQEAWLLDDNENTMALGTDGSFTLTYASQDELVRGIKVQRKVLRNDPYRGYINQINELTLQLDLSAKPVTITDAASGIQLLSNTNYVSADAVLSATKVEDTGSTESLRDPWANMQNHVGNVMNQMYFYTLSLQDGGKTVEDLGTSAILRFPIAEGMNKNGLRLFWNGFDEELQGVRYGWLTDYAGIDGNYYTAKFEDWADEREISGNFGFYDEKSTNATGENLADGTYKVPITTFNEAAPGQTSMSAACVGTEATLVVKDGVKRLELNFSPVNIDPLKGYMIQMWYTDKEAKEHEVTYTSYYRNEDGSLLVDELNKDTGLYYPKTGWMILPTDESQFMTRFRVSAMDAIMPGQDATREAIFTIYYDQIEKISDETPDAKPGEILNPVAADKTDLNAKLEEAKGLVSQTDKYTEASLTALQTAIDAAQAVADKADATQADVDAQVTALQAAVDGLKVIDPNAPLDKDNLADGKYTVDIRMKHINRNQYSMSDAAVEHTVDLEVKDGKYYATLDFKGLKIATMFGYLKELYYYADGYTYNQYGAAQGERIAAEVLSTQKNADGSDVVDFYNDDNKDGVADYLYPDLLKIEIVPTAIADPDGYAALHVFVPVMDSITPGSGDQDALMQIDWSTLKKAETPADKTALNAKLEEAKGLVAQTDQYTEESLAALQAAIDAAQAVADKADTAQADVDAQVAALQTAMDDLKAIEKPAAADKTALNAKLEEAKGLVAQTDQYTEESLAALQAAIDAAQAVADKADAAQADVDAQVTALQTAMDGLKAIEGGETPAPTPGEGEQTGGQDKGQNNNAIGGNKLPGNNKLDNAKNSSLNKNAGTGVETDGAAAVAAGLMLVAAAGLAAYRKKSTER